MLGLFITVAISLMGIMGRILWTQQKRLTQIEITLEAQKEEISFIKALIEKLKASSTNSSRPEACCKHAPQQSGFLAAPVVLIVLLLGSQFTYGTPRHAPFVSVMLGVFSGFANNKPYTKKYYGYCGCYEKMPKSVIVDLTYLRKKATKKVEIEKTIPITKIHVGIGVVEMNLLNTIAPKDHLLISNRYLLRFSICRVVIQVC